jgi:hypothetical protein
MPRKNPCPFCDQPANEGGHMDASVGEQGAAVLQFRYTPEQGTADPHAPCAFLALSQQALTQQEIDRTQACRRCARVIRVYSVKTPSVQLLHTTQGDEQLKTHAQKTPPLH